MNNPMVAERQDGTGTWTGVWLAEDIQTLVDGIGSGSWIDGAIGGFGSTLDTLGLISDPLGTVFQWGVAWLMEHVQPLAAALDSLAGDPAQISAYAQTWRNVAAGLTDAGTGMHDAVGTDLAGWVGAAADAYRQRSGDQTGGLDGLARAARGLALVTEGTGLVVAQVRMMVRDLIANFVSTLLVRLPEWVAAAACTIGLATPWVVAQVSRLVATFATEISRLIRALTTSVERLTPLLRRLAELVGELAAMLRRLARRNPVGPTRPPARRPPKTPRLRRNEPFTTAKRRPSLNQYRDVPPAVVERHNGIRTNPEARVGVFKEPFPSKVTPPSGRTAEEYWQSYEAAVRADHNGAPRLTYNTGGKVRITDVGTIEATTERQFGSNKLDQLWSDLIKNDGGAMITVPELTAEGERRLARLASVYERVTGQRPTISVRETGP
jgi:hypothetical protein